MRASADRVRISSGQNNDHACSLQRWPDNLPMSEFAGTLFRRVVEIPV